MAVALIAAMGAPAAIGLDTTLTGDADPEVEIVKGGLPYQQGADELKSVAVSWKELENGEIEAVLADGGVVRQITEEDKGSRGSCTYTQTVYDPYRSGSYVKGRVTFYMTGSSCPATDSAKAALEMEEWFWFPPGYGFVDKHALWYDVPVGHTVNLYPRYCGGQDKRYRTEAAYFGGLSSVRSLIKTFDCP
jgi:hypothetical protein